MTDESPAVGRHRSGDRPLGAVAQRLTQTLNDDLGETVVGVAAYEDGEYDVAYQDDAVSAQYSTSDVRAIMENIQLDAIGATAYEEHHGQALHATVRVYDTLVTVAVQVTETAGLVVVLRNDGSHDPYAVIETVENAAA